MTGQLEANMQALYEAKEQSKKKDEDIKDLKANIGNYVVMQAIFEKKEKEMLSYVESLDDRLAEKDDLFNTMQDEMNKKLSKQEELYQNKLSRTIEELHLKFAEESQRMVKDFEQARLFFASTIQQYEKKLEEAAIKYMNREPRPIDIEKIAELERELEQSNDKRKEIQVFI
jgi:hypothetical protein